MTPGVKHLTWTHTRSDCTRSQTALVLRRHLRLQNGDLNPELAALEDQFGAPRGEARQWGSCVRITDAKTLSPTTVVHMDNNEAALCMCLVTFAGRPDLGELLAVGTAKALQFYPREAEGALPPHLPSTAALSAHPSFLRS